MKQFIFLFFAIPFLSIAQQNDDSVFIKKISDEILVNGQAYDQLRYLTKNIGGRLAGSPQFTKAIQWAKKTMENCGADNVFLQQCMVPHWVRGKGDKVAIVSINNKPANIVLNATALGNSYGSGKPVTAKVLAVKSFDELEKRKDEVKGKIVFYNYSFNPAYILPDKAYGESGTYRYTGASRAAKYGAVGMVIRSLSGSTDNNPHTGGMRYDSAYPIIPAAALGLQDADKLWNECQNNPVTLSLLTHGKMLPDAIGYNVIAELKGTEFPDEYIVVGGHLDSWDINEGAHDDGTGVVQTIEVMRTLKVLNYKPKHTLRFVLFANEENGLRGGLKYAEEAKAKNEKHIFALETDAGGFTPRGFGLSMSPEQFKKAITWQPLLKDYLASEFTNSGGGADIGPLQRTLGTPVGNLSPDNQRYFDVHHSAGDVFEKVNKRELLLGAVDIAGLIYLIDKYGL